MTKSFSRSDWAGSPSHMCWIRHASVLETIRMKFTASPVHPVRGPCRVEANLFDAKDLVLVVDHNLWTISRIDLNGVMARSFQLLICPWDVLILTSAAVSAAWKLLHATDINLHFQHAANARVWGDGFGFGCLRRQSKVDATPTPAVVPRPEARSDNAVARIWAGLVIQSHHLAAIFAGCRWGSCVWYHVLWAAAQIHPVGCGATISM